MLNGLVRQQRFQVLQRQWLDISLGLLDISDQCVRHYGHELCSDIADQRFSFDQLYEEGEAGSPKMMVSCIRERLLPQGQSQADIPQTIGLHCRVIGKPGRFPALTKVSPYESSRPLTALTEG